MPRPQEAFDSYDATLEGEIAVLKRDIETLYHRTVAEVTKAEDGKPYRPSRLWQWFLEAEKQGDAEVLAFVIRTVERETEGFGRLEHANRLDLTLEALVVDPLKPYHGRFDPALVRIAAARLAHAQTRIARS